jgi:hypothetical protein
VCDILCESKYLDPFESRTDFEIVVDLQMPRIREPFDWVDPKRRDHRGLTETIVLLLVESEDVQVIEHGCAHPRSFSVGDESSFGFVLGKRSFAFSVQVELIGESNRIADLEPGILIKRFLPEDEEEEGLNDCDGRGPFRHRSAGESFRMSEESRV